MVGKNELRVTMLMLYHCNDIVGFHLCAGETVYEQRVIDIDKAQAQTVYKLSRVIGCEMEDLLEKPME